MSIYDYNLIYLPAPTLGPSYPPEELLKNSFRATLDLDEIDLETRAD